MSLAEKSLFSPSRDPANEMRSEDDDTSSSVSVSFENLEKTGENFIAPQDLSWGLDCPEGTERIEC